MFAVMSVVKAKIFKNKVRPILQRIGVFNSWYNFYLKNNNKFTVDLN